MTLKLTVVALAWALCSQAHADNTAFYYGSEVPSELLTTYDQVVVEPGHVKDVPALSEQRAVLVAYLSLGEVTGERLSRVDPGWIIGQNSAWGSRIIDLTQPGYRAFVLNEFEGLWQAGYRRFFLDTLDSYELAKTQPRERAQQLAGLAGIIRALAVQHPDARLILNRGFALLPEVASVVHGVVAESLFDGFDAANNSYVRVRESDRSWLLARLREVKQRYRLPITVIDYRPPLERAEARQTAQRIAALGFSPWVCNGSLTDVGVGALEILPRRVLILSDSDAPDVRPGPARWLAPVLEYLGYVPEYHALRDPLPDGPLTGRYAGIITSLQTPDAGQPYAAWLHTQVQAAVPVVIFGALGFPADGTLAQNLGIVPVPTPRPGTPPKAAEFSTRDELIGFESEPLLHGYEGQPISLQLGEVSRHLELRLANDAVATAIATTSWGGIARSHVFALRGLHGERSWVLNPFAFLARALQLPEIPVPDVTTESGGRVMFVAVDAQGLGDFARLRGRPRVSEILEQRMAAQPWPHALGLAHEPVAADRAALQELLGRELGYEDRIRAGSTATFGVQRSLTVLEPLYVASLPDPISAPMAADVSYLEGSQESYPIQRMLETFEYTDAPRRLRPLALQYHAYAVSAPGGLDALDAIYGWLAHQKLFVVRLSDYRARIRAFREQVIARDLQGAYLAFGGEALRTWRLPSRAPAVDLEHSSAIASLAALPQGRYVTFTARGLRRLQFGAHPRARPYIEQTNGRVELFHCLPPRRGRLRIELGALAQEPLLFQFAGLPAVASCALEWSDGSLPLRTDAQGRSTVALPDNGTGVAALSCEMGRATP